MLFDSFTIHNIRYNCDGVVFKKLIKNKEVVLEYAE